jgi:putative methyltransferase (TIGR04325 family)
VVTHLDGWILPPKFKVLIRACLSRFIGFTEVESWKIAVEKSVGYQDDNVTDPIVDQALHFRLQTKNSTLVSSRYQQVASAMLYCLTSSDYSRDRPWRVLDFGGGGGEYYFQFQALAPNLRLEWTVLETAALSRAMEGSQTGNDNITWISSIEDVAESYDAILCSSVFQYIEEPYEMLSKLSNKSNYLIINRIPTISDRESFVALQRIRTGGRRGSYPAHFFNESDFLSALSEFGDVVLQWTVPEDQPVVRRKAHLNQGVLLRIFSSPRSI